MISTHPAEHPLQKPHTNLARFGRTLRHPPSRARYEALLAGVVALAMSCTALAPHGDGRPLTVLVDVADVSGSGDIKTRCAEVSARVRPVVEDPRTRRLDLLALATGGETGEPTVLVPWTEYVPAAGLYESPASTARQRAAWLLGIERTCVARLRPSDASPVFEAMQRALEAIEARCGDRARERYRCGRKLLAVQSDLRSTFGPFGAYLRSLARRRPKQAPVPVAPRLTLGDVELSLCGFSNTDAGDGLPAEVVLAAWREALGRPVVADPTCAADPIAGGVKS